MTHIYPKPITASRTENPDAFRFFNLTQAQAGKKFSVATNDVLKIIMKMDPNFFPERGAVWFNYEIITTFGSYFVMNKTSDAFPDDKFARNCRFNCIEKTTRTLNMGLACAHQTRNPANGIWGGSARLEYDVITDNGSVPIIVAGACSGRKEWEDLAITLGAKYRVGLVTFDDPQVQHILQLADASVINDPACRPLNMTIGEYTHEIFSRIDRM